MRQLPDVSADWLLPEVQAARWNKVRRVRRVVLAALEQKRTEKVIRSNLDAAPTVYVDAAHQAAFADLDLADILITSAGTLSLETPPEGAFTLSDCPGIAVVFKLADGTKCQRCWKVLSDVGSRRQTPGICGRCSDAVSASPQAAE